MLCIAIALLIQAYLFCFGMHGHLTLLPGVTQPRALKRKLNAP